jgi:alkylresorcinol/alkylpyrone synthase
LEQPKSEPSPRIVATGIALTDHVHGQDEIIDGFNRLWQNEKYDRALFERFFQSVQVETRHLAIPIDEYPNITGFTEANRVFKDVGTRLAEQAVSNALRSADLSPKDVDAIFFTTVTGVSVPTIDALLMNRLDFRSDVKRFPFFGLGCVAGAAGIARMADYLTAYPDQVAILLSVELCSLTLQKGDLSIPAIVSAALFGDGSAAVVAVGGRRNHETSRSPNSGPKIRATKSVFYRDTERVMGWDVGSDGFRVVLSADVPTIVEQNLRNDVEVFLHAHDLRRTDIQSWVCHPGGPKVIEALQRCLELEEHDLRFTWESLRSIGNLSSASILFVLHETIRSGRPGSGTLGLMTAMGPGFCAEMVLCEW